MRKTMILCAVSCLVAFPAGAYAQTREIAGKVHEATTGRRIPNAAVDIVGQQIGACTNERGEYRLRVSGGEVGLAVTAAGFETKIVRLGASDTVANVGMTSQLARAPVGNEPIFVIDGVPVSSAGVPPWNTAYCREGHRIRTRGAN